MLKHSLNKSKTTLKEVQKRYFLTLKMVKHDPSKLPKWPNFWIWISVFRGHVSTFRAEKIHKSRPYKAKNNAQTFLKQLQINFQKTQKTTFLTTKIVKNDSSKLLKWANIWSKISIFGVIYQPLKLKIHLKVGILRSKKCSNTS